jgi:MFS family permease
VNVTVSVTNGRQNRMASRSVGRMGVGTTTLPVVHPVEGRWRMLVLCTLAAGMAQGFGRFSYPVLLPSLREDLLSSYGSAGLIGTLNVAAYLVGSVGVMIVSMRVAGHRLMAAGLCLTTVALVVMATAQSVPQLAVGMILAGLGGAGVWVPAPGVAASLFPLERRGVASGASGVGIGLCMLFASQLARVAPDLWGDESWRVVWWLMAGLTATIVVAVWALLRPPPAPAHADPPTFDALRRVPAWRAISLAYACFGLAYVLYVSYLVAALQEDAGFSAGHAANVFGLMAATTIVGGPLLGQVSDRVGRRTTLIAGFLLAGVGAASVLTDTEPWIAIGAVCFGLSFSGLVSGIAAYIGDHSAPHQFASAFGAVTVAFALAQAGGPYLGGWLRDLSGDFVAVFAVSAIAWLIGGLACLRLAPSAARSLRPGSAASSLP